MPAPPKPQPLPRFPPQSPHASVRVAARMIHLNRNQFMPLSGSLSSATHRPHASRKSSMHLTLAFWKTCSPLPPVSPHTPPFTNSGYLRTFALAVPKPGSLYPDLSAQLQMSPPQRPSLTAVPAPRLGASHTPGSTPSQHRPLPVDLFLM